MLAVTEQIGTRQRAIGLQPFAVEHPGFEPKEAQGSPRKTPQARGGRVEITGYQSPLSRISDCYLLIRRGTSAAVVAVFCG